MGNGKHIMLSYNWDHQILVSGIYDRLTAEGIPCWMDIKGDMAGSINDAMADGAERAALIVSFCTAKYQESKNCRRELMYADQEGVKIIPVHESVNTCFCHFFCHFFFEIGFFFHI